jgi:oligopeptide transport system substrate-binding protein
MKTVLALLLAGALTGVVAPVPRARAEGGGHVLRVRLTSDPQSFDWHLYRNALDGWIISNLMEGLVQISPKGKALPALATSWKKSRDLRTWTFTLRKNVKWSDGVPLKAADFVASWQRALAPTTSSNNAPYLFDIVNAEAFHAGTVTDFKQVGVKALDDATLEVTLRSPMADWSWYGSLPSLFPIREDLIRRDAMGWARPGKLVTLGPFTLQSFEPGRHVVLVENPNYYGKHGNVVQIDFGIVPDDSLAVSLFDRGQLDLVAYFNDQISDKLKGRRDLVSWPEWTLSYLMLNAKAAPTSDPRVRRAISMAIDRKELAQFMGEQCDPAYSIVPPGLEGSFASTLPSDPAGARKLLESTGVTLAKPLTLIGDQTPEGTRLARFVEGQLKKNLGIAVSSELKPTKEYFSIVTNHGAYSIDLAWWSCDFPDPDDYFMIFQSSAEWVYGMWANEEYDRLIVAARSYPEHEGRALAYKRAQKILLDQDAIAVPLCFRRGLGLVGRRVKGFKPGPMSWYLYRDLSVD